MATRPVRSEHELSALIDEARRAAAQSGELHPARGPYCSPLGETERTAVARILGDGTYRELADRLSREDPEIADL